MPKYLQHPTQLHWMRLVYLQRCKLRLSWEWVWPALKPMVSWCAHMYWACCMCLELFHNLSISQLKRIECGPFVLMSHKLQLSWEWVWPKFKPMVPWCAHVLGMLYESWIVSRSLYFPAQRHWMWPVWLTSRKLQLSWEWVWPEFKPMVPS